ncbi:Uncharacterized protein family UPF0150 [Halothece sp. PCC 7418]|nr:Uncharacterized protein family UPF0150 [Halothece sp. PCC 7418]
MKGEFTAIIEEAKEGGYWAICPEIPGANGQGETIEEAKESLKGAIQLIFEDRLADIRQGLSQSAIEETISISKKRNKEQITNIEDVFHESENCYNKQLFTNDLGQKRVS